MRFRLNRTPKYGDLFIEFYIPLTVNNFQSADTINDLNIFDFFGIKDKSNKYLYRGNIEDCPIYPDAIDNLLKRCTIKFTHVKITKL